MSGRRTLPALATAIAPVMLAIALALPLVLVHGTYRALYPLFLLAGVAVRALGGRVAQVIALVVAILLGPLVWHLGGDGGAAEMFGLAHDAGAEGMAEYVRNFVFAPAPIRAWLLLACLVLLGYAVAEIVRSTVPRVMSSGITPGARIAAAVLATGVAVVLAVPLVSMRAGEVRHAWLSAERARDDDRLFVDHVDTGLPRLDHSPLASRRDVDVVLYVGESTSRWDWSLYGYPRPTTAALDSGLARNRMIAFTHALALPRSGDAPADGLSSLPFLYQTHGDLVVPLVQTLARAGVRTVWLNATGTPWPADTALTGAMRIATSARYDNELLNPLREVLDDASGRQLVVVESHAGRFPWCRNIPPGRRRRWNDWMAHLPDAAIWGDGPPRRAALDCYDSAMRHGATTLHGAMLLVDRAVRPTLLVYVANRGEDAWGLVRGGDVARSPRVTDVPLVVYANASFMARHAEMIASARRHRDDVVVTSWLHDALLDLFDVTTTTGGPAFEQRLSVFGSRFDPRAAGAAPVLAARDTVFCTHRANSLFKYLEGIQAHDCAEMDVVVGADGSQAFVYHPPASNPGLPLYDLLARAGLPRRGLWLDVKTMSERNAPVLLAKLSAIVPAPARARVLVETSNDGLARLPAARAFGDSGFVLSYYLPTDLGCVCMRAGDATCSRETERLVHMLDGGAFRGVSFDARGRTLARVIQKRISPRPVLNAWTPMDRCPNGARAAPLDQPELDTLRGEVQKYLVRMPSSFTH
jgi:glucan phosphoethanolaminetransferase (alkaline phosphatase superfamily)